MWCGVCCDMYNLCVVYMCGMMNVCDVYVCDMQCVCGVYTVCVFGVWMMCGV